jgi:putative transposase
VDGAALCRLERRATSRSLPVVLGIRRRQQQPLLAAWSMDGETEAAWRAPLDDLVVHRRRKREFLIADGAAGLEKAPAALWPAVPWQRPTAQKYRNLLAPLSGRATRCRPAIPT